MAISFLYLNGDPVSSACRFSLVCVLYQRTNLFASANSCTNDHYRPFIHCLIVYVWCTLSPIEYSFFFSYPHLFIHSLGYKTRLNTYHQLADADRIHRFFGGPLYFGTFFLVVVVAVVIVVVVVTLYVLIVTLVLCHYCHIVLLYNWIYSNRYKEPDSVSRLERGIGALLSNYRMWRLCASYISTICVCIGRCPMTMQRQAEFGVWMVYTMPYRLLTIRMEHNDNYHIYLDVIRQRRRRRRQRRFINLPTTLWAMFMQLEKSFVSLSLPWHQVGSLAWWLSAKNHCDDDEN